MNVCGRPQCYSTGPQTGPAMHRSPPLLHKSQPYIPQPPPAPGETSQLQSHHLCALQHYSTTVLQYSSTAKRYGSTMHAPPLLVPPAVHHVHHILNRQARLSNVGRKHNLAHACSRVPPPPHEPPIKRMLPALMSEKEWAAAPPKEPQVTSHEL